MTYWKMLCAYRRSLSREIHSFVQTKSAASLPEGFKIFPEFLSLTEQRTLLSAALSKLDSTETKQARMRRRDFLGNHPQENRTIEDLFLPDAYYNFEEVARRFHRREFGL